jgi:hypothetical protein
MAGSSYKITWTIHFNFGGTVRGEAYSQLDEKMNIFTTCY